MAPDAPTPAEAALTRRWQKLVLIGEGLWLAYLVFDLISTFAAPNFPLRNNYFFTVVDIPANLAARLAALGADAPLGIIHEGAPRLANVMFTIGYQLTVVMATITALVAAVRGRWLLVCLALVMLLLPPEFFGSGNDGPTGNAVLVAIVAAGRCLITRRLRPLAPVLGMAALVFACHTLVKDSIGTYPVLVIHDNSDPAQAMQLQAIDRALDAVAPRDSAAQYVRAQIAYIRHDWPELKRIGPIQSRRLEASPYRLGRIYVINESLRQLAGQPASPASRDALWSVLRVISLGLAAMGLGVTITNAMLHRRIRRLDKIAAALAPLRRMRTA